jgi:hypothetical protein
MNGDSTDDLNYKKKKRKLEEAKDHLLKEGEKNDEETDIKQYSKEDAYNLMQEIETRRKHRVNPNIDGMEVQQGTGGNEMNDSGSYLNYKRKKRKLEKDMKEHLLMEEETMKQDGRMSVMESYNEKDMYSCELEDSTIKKKKKRKEKDCPDAQGKEVAERNEITVLNGNIVTGSNCKKRKRKLKQEVKERMEDEIMERAKIINDDSNSSIPTICYKSEKICEKYSLQENDESVDDQDRAPTGDRSVHKKDSSRKFQNHKKSIEEVDHREMKDHKPMEEETMKHKVKKKKKRKYSKDGNIHDIQEHKHVQYNLEEILTESCNRKKCEELSVVGETSVSVNCKNDEEKEKRKKRKLLNRICADVQLECEKEERIQDQEDTEKNQRELETATQNDIKNVDSSKQARSNYKQKQDICNSDVQNSAGANIKINDFENTDLNRRNMKPSVFSQLVDPSLIKFRGSNLRKIPGYGCYWI